MPSSRVEKTLVRLKSGALSSPAPTRTFMVGGMGDACRGCGETIGGVEKAYYIRTAQGEFFGVHLLCYDTWTRFVPRPRS